MRVPYTPNDKSHPTRLYPLKEHILGRTLQIVLDSNTVVLVPYFAVVYVDVATCDVKSVGVVRSEVVEAVLVILVVMRAAGGHFRVPDHKAVHIVEQSRPVRGIFKENTLDGNVLCVIHDHKTRAVLLSVMAERVVSFSVEGYAAVASLQPSVTPHPNSPD